MSRFRFVVEEAAQVPVSLLCRTIGVSRGGFHAWRRRPPSQRAVVDAELSERIWLVHADTEGIYGALRIYKELVLEQGLRLAC